MGLLGNRRAVLAGFAGGVALLAALAWFVGLDRFLARLSSADPAVLALVVAVAFAWLLAWGLALRAVLAILGYTVSVPVAFLVYAAAVFANNVTPFGQAGGEPFTALLVSRVADSEYETGLAAIASVDVLHFVPSIGFATLGVSYYALTVSLSDRLEVAAAGLAVLALAVAVGVTLGWRFRYRLETGVVRVFTPLVRRVAGVVPRVSKPSRASLRDRIDGFFRSIERISGDRRRLLVALSLSGLGWLGLMTSLWLSLYAVGLHPAPAVPLVAVPLAALVSITPLPGGLGGIEAALVAVVVSVTGFEVAAVGAGVFVHRAATYWLPVVVGGGATTALGARR